MLSIGGVLQVSQKEFAVFVNWDIIWTGSKIKMYCLALLILACTLFTVCSNFAARSIIDAVGFTVNGIAAGSWAERLETFIAYIDGGTLPPESFITTLQSIGIEGFSLSTKFLLGTVGALIFLLISMNLRNFLTR
ncbi:interferon alpha-inducible protein 27, mitochondrial-like isoform X3 [Mobula birostris]|uniref:interferon alpha-inducible protein 27, mitochondrial-like isoform X3 n=1 Tax=Mobula birostris TaxID=1983395 RepID=UPI003B282CB4